LDQQSFEPFEGFKVKEHIMSNVLNDVRTKALELPPTERELLIHDLLVSLDDGDDTDESVEVAWAAEIARRSDEVHFGTAKLIDGDEVLKRVRAAAKLGEA
jgi:putative addiction module component (TIGR02574 family)